MSESFWQEPYETLELPKGTIFAQTFSPLWSHSVDYIRFFLKELDWPGETKLSIQYLKPDGTPTGIDLTTFNWWWKGKPWSWGYATRNCHVDPVRLVVGINYALLIETLDYSMPHIPTTRYQPPPSGYPRGKLIKSEDGGDTWDTTDLGDILFSEFGYPPLQPTPYNPPFDHWAITDYLACDYKTSSCIRMASSTPTKATIMIAVEKPKPIEEGVTVRGVTTMCLDHYTFKVDRSYPQLEKNESIYHTFNVRKLKKGEKYWFAFVADANFSPTLSASPIFEKVHPEAPPFTTIRRPDAPGDRCHNELTGNGLPCPDHYLTVNEATPDEEVSQLIGNTINNWYRYDLYNIPDLPANSRPIEQVHITARLRRGGGYAYVHLAKVGIKVNGVEWWTPSINYIPATYENFHFHLYENPVTGLPWTPQEANDLQIGISLRRYRTVGWSSYGFCTQLYCKIIHDCSAYE